MSETEKEKALGKRLNWTIMHIEAHLKEAKKHYKKRKFSEACDNLECMEFFIKKTR